MTKAKTNIDAQEAEAEQQEQEPQMRIFKFRVTSMPITTYVSKNIPGPDGRDIPYSTYHVGFTQMPIEVDAEVEVEVEDTGNGLKDFSNALREFGLSIFEANIEFSREAWKLQRDIAKRERLEELADQL